MYLYIWRKVHRIIFPSNSVESYTVYNTLILYNFDIYLDYKQNIEH